jgi:hypothetical protein
MEVFSSPEDYLYNLHTCSPGEAKRIWKNSIKESFDYKCAYCGSREELTLDHVVPKCAGGLDETRNLVSCCFECNKSKSQENWKSWYKRQSFYDPYKEQRILEWQKLNTSNFSSYVETERAKFILTRNNFVYKKLNNS